jgi:ABC-type transport system involved in cytochrome c biogenesis permease subunit
MKKWLPWIITAVVAAWIVSALRPAPESDAFHVKEFGRLPVLLNGRVQPFDSVARNTLLTIHGTQTVRPPKGNESQKTLSATEWLLEVMTKPEEADKRKIFRVENIDLRNLLGAREGRLGQIAFIDLEKSKVEELQKQAEQINETKKEAQLRTGYEKDVIHLYDSLILYHRLKNTLKPSDSEDFAEELKLYRESMAIGIAAFQKTEKGEQHDEKDLELFARFFRRYQDFAKWAYPLVVPPAKLDESRDGWVNVGASLLEAIRGGQVHPAVDFYARMISAYRGSSPADFNKAVAEYRGWLAEKSFGVELNKGKREAFFNYFEPFYKSTLIYVITLLLGCAFWLNLSEWMRRSAYYLLLLAFGLHSVGLIFRMFLEGRPPITNLYSSAIFVGWGAVVLGIILERIFRNSIGIVTASVVGFVTQIIAHNLAQSGDTMQMLQAVLDTNIWLATHVVIINIGYSSNFLAGALAIIFIVLGVFTRVMNPSLAKSLTKMVYGIICFATLFTFVGTILGGIWADQSWGRFWGWDPKENGALLIVLLNALILHARWGGMIRERGLMALAICGNIVTGWSWFGVNMLGVGLHSYGFMDEAFKWLLTFVISQLAIIGLALLPLQYWRSFRPAKGALEDSGAAGEPASANA